MIIHKNFDITNYNTFGIKAKCKIFCELTDKSDYLSIHNYIDNSNYFLLGGGSNVLFLKDYEHSIIYNSISEIKILENHKSNVIVEVQAGTEWDKFVLWSVKNNYYGIENLSGIPGKIGATPVQNIGAYGVEASQYIESVKVYDIKTKTINCFSNSECCFAYRDSIFKNNRNLLVLSVVFKLSKEENYTFNYANIEEQVKEKGVINLLNVRNTIIEIRNSKLPDTKLYGNAGSFFKNPIIENTIIKNLKEKYPNIPTYKYNQTHSKIAAAWLIENAELKGFTLGNAAVHNKQALVLINKGNAIGEDVKNLADYVQKTVFEKFNIVINPEVVYV